jgi:hypothetical protein
LGPGFVHLQGASFDRLAVDLRDGLFHVRSRGQLHEPEPAGPAGVPVADHSSGVHLKTSAVEQLSELFVGGFEGKVPDIKLAHLLVLLENIGSVNSLLLRPSGNNPPGFGTTLR